MSDLPMSVIVITLNEEQTISHLMEDLKQQTIKEFEVIVVDSNSDDGTVALAKEHGEAFEEFKIVEMEGRGVSLGRNTGAEQAKYEHLIFLDADSRVDNRFIEKAQSVLAQTGLKVAGGRMKATEAKPLIRMGIKSFDLGMLLTQGLFPTAVGACIFSTKTVHQEIGGFDTRIHLCEDCDYVRRASKIYRFRMIPVFFEFDTRRLKEQGLFKTGLTYLKANLYRWFFSEITNNQIAYEFGQHGK